MAQPPPPTRAEIANRIRAARHLRGWTAQELVDQINYDGHAPTPLSIKQLREIEQEKRTASADELGAIAYACEMPAWFFAAPHDELFTDQQANLEELIAVAVRSEMLGTNDRLERLADQVTDLRDDLVRSEVIKPRGSGALQVAEGAAKRRAALPSRGPESLPRQADSGKG
jgi:transcriptional regulator with XRE-family HTH domain